MVDGHNLLLRPGYPRPAGGPLESARRTLVGLLRTFASRQPLAAPLWVVFDVRDPSGGLPPGSRDAWIEVEFAASADDRIAARVAADPAPGEITVVTSDAELARRVSISGARVESSDAFLARLFARPRRCGSGGGVDALGGKPAPPKGDALLRDLEEQGAPRDPDE